MTLKNKACTCRHTANCWLSPPNISRSNEKTNVVLFYGYFIITRFLSLPGVITAVGRATTFRLRPWASGSEGQLQLRQVEGAGMSVPHRSHLPGGTPPTRA